MTEMLFNPAKSKEKGTHEWLQEKQTSNWATHMEEAHIKYKLQYYRE